MLVWISPLDVCVLARARRLVKRHGPEVLSKINIHDLCKATDAPGDHELMRLSTSQVFILWMLGGCRDSSGCALRAPDGNLVCAFWNASVATAKLKSTLAAVPRGVTGGVASMTGGIANSFGKMATNASLHAKKHEYARKAAHDRAVDNSETLEEKAFFEKNLGAPGRRQSYYDIKNKVFSSIHKTVNNVNEAALLREHNAKEFQQKQQAYETCLNRCKRDRDEFVPRPLPQKPTETGVVMHEQPIATRRLKSE